jgi:hypothetical protein
MPRPFRRLAVAGSAMFAGAMLVIRVIEGEYRQGLSPAGLPDGFVQDDEYAMRADSWLLLHKLRIVIEMVASVLEVVTISC